MRSLVREEEQRGASSERPAGSDKQEAAARSAPVRSPPPTFRTQGEKSRAAKVGRSGEWVC